MRGFGSVRKSISFRLVCFGGFMFQAGFERRVRSRLALAPELSFQILHPKIKSSNYFAPSSRPQEATDILIID